MSVRAYRINKLEYESLPTFNLWHDTKITEWLQNAGYLEKFDENGGEVELPVDIIKEMLDELDWAGNEYTKKQFQIDIKWAEKKKKEYIMYSCF